jgi:hypothetical protein
MKSSKDTPALSDKPIERRRYSQTPIEHELFPNKLMALTVDLSVLIRDALKATQGSYRLTYIEKLDGSAIVFEISTTIMGHYNLGVKVGQLISERNGTDNH